MLKTAASEKLLSYPLFRDIRKVQNRNSFDTKLRANNVRPYNLFSFELKATGFRAAQNQFPVHEQHLLLSGWETPEMC